VRFLFDTSILIDYLENEKSISADAIFKASEIGKCYISIISIMELYQSNKRRRKVEEEVRRIHDICRLLNIKIVYITLKAQQIAIDIIKNYYSNLGTSCIPDALIIGTGIVRKAYIVTGNYGAWSTAYSQVLTPEEVIKRF
jgi:predicted nucleic acid-binding protein